MNKVTIISAMLGTSAEGIPILYGGSVTPQNIKELVGIEDLDGVLVVVKGISSAGGTLILEATDCPPDMTERTSDVTMKITAAPTVILLKNVPGPRLPKMV